MKFASGIFLACVVLVLPVAPKVGGAGRRSASSLAIFGFRDSAAETAMESRFLAVPDPRKAEEDLRILTRAPHMAGTPEDKETADFVAQKFREAGLETEVAEYKVWMNDPAEISVDVTAPPGVAMHGPRREHVAGDPFQDDPRIVTPFNGQSPSGDVEAEVVYANYGTPADFKKLDEMKVGVRGKIVIMRYGANFRGVKVLLAQEHGAAGVLLYSDPYDDGWRQGDVYPKGPWRPATGVQRGSVGFMFEFPGDPTTPGIASVPDLPGSTRILPEQSAELPKIPSTPLSYGDAAPILEYLGGPETPRDWQGSLPFTYHVGPGPVKVHMRLKQDYAYRTIWDVIGRVQGTQSPDAWVIAGNHRDAWVFGAVDPNSGTAAMLEAARGLGELVKSGWRPKRTIVFASWDGEEEGLIGSTEWAEQHAEELAHAVAYFNVDIGVAGPRFAASSVPSLKQFLREVARAVPSPRGGTVYEAWRKTAEERARERGLLDSPPAAQGRGDVPVGDLGSGSDYTPFLQHLGVPATDITSRGRYGVYHSAFDDFTWFTRFADPDFLYEQEMARIFGLEVLRMADADVLPFDYEDYGKEVEAYIEDARKKAEAKYGTQAPSFAEAAKAAQNFERAGAKILTREEKFSGDAAKLNSALPAAEHALLIPGGLPNRPWYAHSIYAPGMHTGYAAVVIPGVNEAMEEGNRERAQQQLDALAAALNRAAKVLEAGR